MNQQQERVVDGVIVFVAHLSALPFYAGVISLGWQVFTWLKSGNWPPFSTLDVARWTGIFDSDWLAFPDSWVGLWKAMNWLPGWVGLCLMSIPLAFLLFSIATNVMDAILARINKDA